MVPAVKKVFVCDDHEDMVNVVRDILQFMGLESRGCSDSTQAVKMIKEYKPDLIVSDIQMPIFSGVDLLRSLNEHDFKIPVIFLTGVKELKVYQETYVNGHFDFLNKPLNPFDLIKAVEKALVFGHTPVGESRFVASLRKAASSN